MINLSNKSKEFSAHDLMPAGLLPQDSSIEFIGLPETKEVLWMQNGNLHYFRDMPSNVLSALQNLYSKDISARNLISSTADSILREIELYCYYMFGSLDSYPDFKDELSISENFRDSDNCISQSFDFKSFHLGNQQINLRELRMIDLMKKELPDKAIADDLGISMSTLDFHKRNLYHKANCLTKVGLVMTAIQYGI